MQKVEVQMSPKPYDTKRIFCSQGDTELRKFGFILKDGINNVDITDISDPVFTSFPVSAGGTEELLPTNTSTPTTSPIVADIRYPDGLRQEETFTYRESPTSLDGNAKIKALYGNSLAWNQLCRTLESGNWAIVGAGSGTLTFADGVATFSTTNNYGRFLYTPNNLVNGHKYLLSVEIKAYANASINYALGSQTSYGSQGCICPTGQVSDTNWRRYTSIGTFTSGTDDKVLVQNASGASNLHEIQVRNIMYFDLTQMGLDISDPSEFTSLFPLSYYPYTTGALLDFKGTEIKTTGKNLLPPSTSFGSAVDITIDADNGVYTLNGTPTAYRQAVATDSFVLEPGTYRFSKKSDIANNSVSVQLRSVDGLTTYAQAFNNFGEAFTLANRVELKFRIVINASAGTLNNYIIRPMLEFGSVATDFEPYTESTTSLPTLTYFPTGMKSAGSVRDELTDNKAITKVGQVDLGTLNWTYDSTVPRFITTDLANVIKRASASYVKGNMASIYETVSFDTLYSAKANMTMALNTVGNISLINTAYTTPSAFKTAMSGVLLNYELATSSEESIMSATLVTNDAEVPLYKEGDLMVGDCTEELSKTAGIKTCKIRFTDADGDCYSNKIKLSVEERP